MKRILAILLMLLLLSSCSMVMEEEPVDIEKINAEETYPNGMYSLEVLFSTPEEIYEFADLVIDGRVIQCETATSGGFPQTCSTVRVEGLLKGTGTEKIVRVWEDGGMTESGELVTVGVPPMEVGQKVLLFLVETGLPDSEGEYYVAGSFQGKFICREGYYFQQATENVKLTKEEYYPASLKEIAERLCSGK